MLLKVSVVVPVYGVERYIEQCLLSVQQQTLRETEIIVVNDASEDNCQQIINRLAAEDPRIVPIALSKNLGQGFARNAGLDVARGEYVWFLDGDDFMINRAHLRRVFERAIHDDADMVRGRKMIERVEDANGKFIRNRKDKTEDFFTEEFSSATFAAKPVLLQSRHFCNWLYRREFLNSNQIRFVNPQWEERPFVLKALLRARCISTTTSEAFVYRIRGNSTARREKEAKDVELQLANFQEVLSLLREAEAFSRDGELWYHGCFTVSQYLHYIFLGFSYNLAKAGRAAEGKQEFLVRVGEMFRSTGVRPADLLDDPISLSRQHVASGAYRLLLAALLARRWHLLDAAIGLHRPGLESGFDPVSDAVSLAAEGDLESALVHYMRALPDFPAITVIVPVYNAEQHLDACLDSVLGQSLKEIEVICVDDCSTDGSFGLLAARSASDVRLRVLRHNANAGEGAARNTGLDAAQGSYVFNLDADDTLPPGALEKLYGETTAHDSDLVKGCFALIDAAGNLQGQTCPAAMTRTVNTNLQHSSFLRRFPVSHCSYLYRRALLEEYRIRYPTDLLAGADRQFVADALVHAKTVTLIPDIIYNYHQSAVSVTRGNFDECIVLDAISAKRYLVDRLIVAGFNGDAKEQLRDWSYIIKEWLARLPGNLDHQKCVRIFEAIRHAVHDVDVPWKLSTPAPNRHLLALIREVMDERALQFIAEGGLMADIEDAPVLRRSLEFVHSLMPEDFATNMDLARLDYKEKRFDEAAEGYQLALQARPANLWARIEYAGVLSEQGRFDRAHQMLDEAFKYWAKGARPLVAMRRLVEQRQRLFDLEVKRLIEQRQQLFDLEVKRLIEQQQLFDLQVRRLENELVALRSSLSWRLTKPLRTASDLLRLWS